MMEVSSLSFRSSPRQMLKSYPKMVLLKQIRLLLLKWT